MRHTVLLGKVVNVMLFQLPVLLVQVMVVARLVSAAAVQMSAAADSKPL